MFMLFLSLITGFIGFMLGSAMGLETLGGFVGFFSPSIIMLQRLYIKVEDLERKYLDDNQAMVNENGVME